MPTIEPARKMWTVSTTKATADLTARLLRVSFRTGYQVVHSADIRDDDVYTASGLPSPIQSFSENFPFVVAKNMQANRVSPILSMVIVDWEGEVGSGASSGGIPSSSPINTPPLIDWSNVTEDLEIDEDADGNPIATVIGEPIRGVRAKFVDQVLTVQRKFLFYDSYLQSQYMHSVNSDTFAGWPPGTGKIMDLRGNNVIGDPTNGGFGYWNAVLKVQFRIPYRTTPDKAWYARVRHEGFYERVQAEGPPDPNGNYPHVIMRMVDQNKQPISRPFGLDQTGKKVTNVNNTYWREFKLYNPLPYNFLGFL